MPATPQQKRPISNNESIYQACLLGGAIGDALGAPVEFLTISAIKQRFGENGIQTLCEAYGVHGAITDDTQMTLFTAEGLLSAFLHGEALNRFDINYALSASYQRWLHTQAYHSELTQENLLQGFLLRQKALFSQRAPGNTCLTALECMTTFGQLAVNDSKGCGGVMRVAPVALYSHQLGFLGNAKTCFEIASDAASLTHGHPSGYLAAGVFAMIIYQVLKGNTLQVACEYALEHLATQQDHEETTQAIQQALTLSELANNIGHQHEYITTLGEGWIAEESLAIALYCVLVSDSFAACVQLAVNHCGDSDSSGSMAGNLWGAMYGLDAIPIEWQQQVELAEVIKQVATDLVQFYPIGSADISEHELEMLKQRYPNWREA